jgi:2-polyprenyl-3-methyl-5-hydroxy-6-metoxy-1,4-benzoquinol methylase
MSTTLSERLRNSLYYRTGLRLPRRYPKTADELAAGDLYNAWWYYSVELLPGLVTRGVYPAELPMLPRLMLRECGDLRGADCLDLGSMEGLVPALMAKGGARSVLATDAVPHCVEKMEAVKHYHGVSFEYRSVGLMYELHEKLQGSFDVINCSGLLYHVVSPLMVLLGLRPLVKRGGLIIVSTNVTLEDRMVMEFNDAGRMQAEENTFWYPTARLYDYWLRYLKLAPVRALFVPHEAVRKPGANYVFDKPSGYLSVLCRAEDDALAGEGDDWMKGSVASSWEYEGLSDWARAGSAPRAVVKAPEPDARFVRRSGACIDLHRFVAESEPLTEASDERDTHLLRLGHTT